MKKKNVLLMIQVHNIIVVGGQEGDGGGHD